MEAWCTAIRVNEFQKIIISSNLFKYLKAKKQGFHLTPIRITIMHELFLRKYSTNISRSNFLKVVKGNFGLELLPHGINMWTSYLVSGPWVGLNLTYFMSHFHVSYYNVAVPCQLLPPCHTTFTTHIRIEQKTKFFKDSISQRCILLLFIIIYIITTISTTTITTLTLQLT